LSPTERTTEFTVSVDIVADMSVVNPFDFFFESQATDFPFADAREFDEELAPYLPEGGGRHVQTPEGPDRGLRLVPAEQDVPSFHRNLTANSGYAHNASQLCANVAAGFYKRPVRNPVLQARLNVQAVVINNCDVDRI
jgi:hypothetical protein